MIKAVVTDIEGTTSSISFVKDVLFPYARKRLPAFVVTHADKPEVQHWLHEAAREAELVSAEQQEIIDLLLRWIDEDRKSTALKALQGMIWEDGYRNGEFRGHVYAEVAENLRKWKAQNIALYVYSSGSVAAQKLLYGYQRGERSHAVVFRLLRYRNRRRSARRNPYQRITAATKFPANEILFLSDIVAELDAAREAGLKTTLLARPPSTCPISGTHPCVTDFSAITLA